MLNAKALTPVSGAVELHIRAEFEQELPALNTDRLDFLRTSIKRDGVQDAIKYRRCPDTGKCEIIDGHNRYKIATELDLPFKTQEIVFDNPSITNALYWMHIFNAARRGTVHDTDRMQELKGLMAKEQGITLSKTQIIKQVAQDANVSERSIWRKNAPTKDKPSPFEYLAKVIGKALSQLSTEERKQLAEMILRE